MHCGDQYPDKPPQIQFISQINLPCVNPRNGEVRAVGSFEIINQAHTRTGRSKQAPMLSSVEERLHHGDRSHRAQKVALTQTLCTTSQGPRLNNSQIHGTSKPQEASSASRGLDLPSISDRSDSNVRCRLGFAVYFTFGA